MKLYLLDLAIFSEQWLFLFKYFKNISIKFFENVPPYLHNLVAPIAFILLKKYLFNLRRHFNI